jgi:8-oxo-dGTP diphosphatase
MDMLTPLNEFQQNVAHRPAKLFQFNKERYEMLQKNGFEFEM